MTNPSEVDDQEDDDLPLHNAAVDGDIEELRAALQHGEDVDEPDDLGATALMLAARFKNLECMELLIQHGADIELTDDFNDTALRYAVQWDFVDGVALLLSLGAERGYEPRYPLKKIERDYSYLHNEEMPEDLKKYFTEERWRKSQLELEKRWRESDQNPTVEPVICQAISGEVLKLLMQAGDDVNLARTNAKRELLGMATKGELQVSSEEYRMHKFPSYGKCNPERMDFPFWMDMIRTGVPTYAPRKKYGDPAFTERGAVWCYDRFGTTLTPLPDGRYVQIAGEHEDHYDPDFFIYNDVVIHDGHGNFQIYGYPKEVFPPTDFHTATLCGDFIYIIGCLGYFKQRRTGFTPVYRLAIDTWQIEFLPTTGEMPSWIHDHSARYEVKRNAICIQGGKVYTTSDDGEINRTPNAHRFELDLDQLRWRQVS